jgi:hypothetical protein
VTVAQFPIRLIVPARFYDDHLGRDLPSGSELRRSRAGVTVDLDREGWDDLLDDAQFYVDMGVSEFGSGCLGLISSARATVLRMQRAIS